MRVQVQVSALALGLCCSLYLRPAFSGSYIEDQAKAQDAGQQQQGEEERARKAALAQQEALDRSNGYRRADFAHLLVDYKGLAAGTKIVMTGWLSYLGQIDALSETRFDTQMVYLEDSVLSPDTRKTLIQCGAATSCVLTIWGHTGCTMTVAGLPPGPCLVLDGVRGGTYDSPTKMEILR